LINAALADSGSDERVDHRSFKERGIAQEPTTHLGPAASEIERRGAVSERGEENREIMASNDARRQLDDLIDELAALDAAIADEMWDRFVFDSESEPSPALTATHQEAVAIAGLHPSQSGEVMEPALSALDAIHQETIAQAVQEKAVMQEERKGGFGAETFQRIAAWWENMRAAFTEWGGLLQERIEGLLHRAGDDPHDPDPEMEPSP
jgi:hypothetical protein